MSNQQTNLRIGVDYHIVLLGGYGWSRGRHSVVRFLTGPKSGKLFTADIGRNLAIHSEISEAELEQRRQSKF